MGAVARDCDRKNENGYHPCVRASALTPDRRRGWALLAFGATALGLTLGACGSTEAADAPRGDCPAAPIRVVATVNQWGQIVEQLGGDCVVVDTIITGSAADPHDYEPTPADSAAFEAADLAVLNGLGYDGWAERTLDQLGDGPAVISAGDAAGAGRGDNPHLWYSPAAVRDMTEAISAELARLGPDSGAYLGARADAWAISLEAYDAAIDDLAKAADGASFASTEPVADDLLDAAGLRNATPDGYRLAALNETDPSPAGLAAFDDLLGSGEVAVLVVNAQSEGPVAEQLRRRAEADGVPVVEVTETVPDDAVGFVAWQVDQLNALTRAVS